MSDFSDEGFSQRGGKSRGRGSASRGRGASSSSQPSRGRGGAASSQPSRGRGGAASSQPSRGRGGAPAPSLPPPMPEPMASVAAPRIHRADYLRLFVDPTQNISRRHPRTKIYISTEESLLPEVAKSRIRNMENRMNVLTAKMALDTYSVISKQILNIVKDAWNPESFRKIVEHMVRVILGQGTKFVAIWTRFLSDSVEPLNRFIIEKGQTFKRQGKTLSYQDLLYTIFSHHLHDAVDVMKDIQDSAKKLKALQSEGESADKEEVKMQALLSRRDRVTAAYVLAAELYVVGVLDNRIVETALDKLESLRSAKFPLEEKRLYYLSRVISFLDIAGYKYEHQGGSIVIEDLFRAGEPQGIFPLLRDRARDAGQSRVLFSIEGVINLKANDWVDERAAKKSAASSSAASSATSSTSSSARPSSPSTVSLRPGGSFAPSSPSTVSLRPGGSFAAPSSPSTVSLRPGGSFAPSSPSTVSLRPGGSFAPSSPSTVSLRPGGSPFASARPSSPSTMTLGPGGSPFPSAMSSGRPMSPASSGLLPRPVPPAEPVPLPQMVPVGQQGPTEIQQRLEDRIRNYLDTHEEVLDDPETYGEDYAEVLGDLFPTVDPDVLALDLLRFANGAEFDDAEIGQVFPEFVAGIVRSLLENNAEDLARLQARVQAEMGLGSRAQTIVEKSLS